MCFLVEHKSYKDVNAAFQIGSYIFSAYLKQINNKEPLSIVIPILLYHGQEKWEYKTLEQFFPKIDEVWKRLIPAFDFVYNDFNRMTDEVIEEANNKPLIAFLLTLKYIWDQDWLSKNTGWLINLAPKDQSGLQKVIAFYIFSRNKFDENVLNSLPEPIKTEVMNTFDVYYEKGIEKGIQKGIQKGIREGIQKGKEAGREEATEDII